MEASLESVPRRHRRNLIMIEVGDKLRSRITEIARENEVSISTVARFLVGLGLDSLKGSLQISLSVPENS